jgi:PAS domain S-box-containing protein
MRDTRSRTNQLLDQLRSSLIAYADRAWTTLRPDPAGWRTQVLSLQDREKRRVLWRAARPLLWLLLGLLIFDLYIFASRFIPSHFKMVPVAPLYPPVAIILAVLLLTPPRRWWVCLAAAYVFQVALYTGFGYPLGFNLVAEAPTVIEPLIAAYLLYRLTMLRPQFATVRELTYYAACVIIAAMIAAFMGAGLQVSLGRTYGPAWLSWLLSDGLASLVLAPALILWATVGAKGLRVATRQRAVEIGLWCGLFVLVGFVALDAIEGEIAIPALIYVPVPLLLWAAVRFGTRGMASALSIFTVGAIVGVVHGSGPFVGHATAANVLTVQFFLDAIGMPLFFLSALMQEHTAAEEASRKSEARYRAVVRNLPHTAVLLFDEQRRHRFADGPGLQALGLTSEGLEGRTVYEAFPADLGALLALRYEAALAGQAVEQEVAHGQQIYHLQVVPMSAPGALAAAEGPAAEGPTAALAENHARGGMVVLQDVTEQWRARDELAHERTLTAALGAIGQEFRTLAEHSPDIIVRLDPLGRALYVNPAGAELLGRPARHWIGKTVADIGVSEEHTARWAQRLRDVVVTRTPATFDVAVHAPDGQVHAMHVRFVPELAEETEKTTEAEETEEGAKGALRSVLVIATDVSALKQAEARLAEQASELNAIFEAQADGVSVFDRQRRLVRANRAYRAILQEYSAVTGLSAEPAFAALPLADQVDRLTLYDERGHAIPREARPTSRALRGETVTGASAMDEWVQRPTGQPAVAVSVSAAPVRDPTGQVAGAVTIVRDVTARRQLERRLAEQEQQYRTLAEHSPDIIVRFDPLLRHLYVSPGAERALRIPAAQRVGKTFAELGLPEALYAPWERTIREVFATGEPRELDVTSPFEGGVTAEQAQYFRGRYVPEFGPDGTVATVLLITIDVTELRRAQARLAEQASELEAIFESQADGVAVYDLHGRFLRANRALRELLGFDADAEYTARPLEERARRLRLFDEQGQQLQPEQWPHWRVLRGEILAGANAMEGRVRTVDGRELWISTTGAPVRAPDGRVTGTVLITRDVTARRALEQQVAEQAARLEAIFEAMADGVLVHDAQGRVLRVNQAYRDLVGLEAEPDFLARSPSERRVRVRVVDQQGQPIPEEQSISQRVLHGEVMSGQRAQDVQIHTLDGRDVWMSTTGAPMRAPDGQITGAVLTARDITARSSGRWRSRRSSSKRSSRRRPMASWSSTGRGTWCGRTRPGKRCSAAMPRSVG